MSGERGCQSGVHPTATIVVRRSASVDEASHRGCHTGTEVWAFQGTGCEGLKSTFQTGQIFTRLPCLLCTHASRYSTTVTLERCNSGRCRRAAAAHPPGPCARTRPPASVVPPPSVGHPKGVCRVHVLSCGCPPPARCGRAAATGTHGGEATGAGVRAQLLGSRGGGPGEDGRRVSRCLEWEGYTPCERLGTVRAPLFGCMPPLSAHAGVPIASSRLVGGRGSRV